MSKITLTNLVNLQNETTAVNAINANNAVITAAMDNTLSRDGTAPNPMSSNLDMNGNQILNLPAPSTINSAARLQDVAAGVPITVNNTPGGTSGQIQFNNGGTFGGIAVTGSGSVVESVSPTFTGLPVIPFTQTGVGAVARTINSKLLDQYYTVTDFGAVGNGIADDTVAIQAALTAACAIGGTCFFPAGTYKITAQLNVTAHCVIMGCGFQAPSLYAANAYDLRSTGFKGSVIVAPANVNIFNCATQDPISIEKLHLTYPVSPIGNTGIAIAFLGSISGIGTSTGSIVRDVYINNAGLGIQAFDMVSFTFDNIFFAYNAACITCKNNSTINYSGSTTSAVAGDPVIMNCTMFGTQGTTAILLLSGSGFKICNNKINGGASGIFQNGIQISPQNLGVPFTMTPGLISNNSIEGTVIGILFTPNASSQGSASGWCITGNEFFTNIGVSMTAGITIPSWIGGVSITGNTFLYDFNNTTVPAVSINGATQVSVVGNIFSSNAPSLASAVFVGTTTTLIRVANNLYGGLAQIPNINAPSVPASTAFVTNTSYVTVEAYIIGGTVTSINVITATIGASQQIATGTGSGISAVLSPGDQIAITYSVAPTWTWRPINP